MNVQRAPTVREGLIAVQRSYIIGSLLLANVLVLSITPSRAQTDANQSQLEFFESRIRPVLVESCYKCHSHKAEKLKANLTLDSKAGWQKGGELIPPILT